MELADVATGTFGEVYRSAPAPIITTSSKSLVDPFDLTVNGDSRTDPTRCPIVRGVHHHRSSHHSVLASVVIRATQVVATRQLVAADALVLRLRVRGTTGTIDGIEVGRLANEHRGTEVTERRSRNQQ